MTSSVLFVSSDLMFTGRASGAVKQLGGRCLVASSQSRVLELLEAERFCLVLLDLEAAGIDFPAVIGAARAKEIPVIAYASHVREQLLESARVAGAEVHPRSRFSAQLDSLLAHYVYRSAGADGTPPPG